MHYNVVREDRSVQLARVKRTWSGTEAAGAAPRRIGLGDCGFGGAQLATEKHRGPRGGRPAAQASSNGGALYRSTGGPQPAPRGDSARAYPPASRPALCPVTV